MELNNISGVGPKTLTLLNKLNIFSVEDLINYYPFKYEVLVRSNLENITDGEKIIIDGKVENKPTIMYLGKKLKKVSFRINTGSYLFNIYIYNRIYFANELKPGMTVTIIGKYDKQKNALLADDIRFEQLSNLPKIESVYYTTYGLSKKTLAKIINIGLNINREIKDYIPHYLISQYDFIDKETSIKEIHNPSNISLLKKAKLRLKYEELFIYMLRIGILKNKYKENKLAIKRELDYKNVDKFISSIPFELTDDQKKVVREILDDLSSDIRMNRLLQGDVGSGKTIVAFIAAYANFLAGYQTAIMVPTEILAKQHFEAALKLFKDTSIKIELLTSSIKNKEKKEICTKLESGSVDLIIGTQSLIQENIKYANLGLIVTDEQQRFGVNQRNTFMNKGIAPDVLSMSATPIPRTYALTIYGDLDVSSIKTKPVGRKSIITKIIQEKDITKVLEAMYEELLLDHQVYVISPLIDDNELDMESIYSLESKMNKAFGNKYKIGIVHGKLDNLQKDTVMNDFLNKKINILISTTVIEVGVDVPNATIIVIFSANNFGLSTLHQLRGRVGRSDIQSYCILVAKEDCERLKILEETNDGFLISEYDFQNRGEGDLFGFKQSGELKFNLANIKKDYKILLKAKEDADNYLNNCNDMDDLCLELMKLDNLN